MKQAKTPPDGVSIGQCLCGKVHIEIGMPAFDVHLIDERDPHLASGIKGGVGMIGTVGTAAAIANAVYHATGRRVRTLPIRCERLL